MEQKKLSKDQALVCAKIFSDYFDRYENVEQYMRDQKLNSMNEKSVTLPGMGPEDDLFSDFSIHPNDMEFKLVESSADNWDKYISIISSHSNMTSIPGKNIRLAIKETKTDK